MTTEAQIVDADWRRKVKALLRDVEKRAEGAYFAGRGSVLDAEPVAEALRKMLTERR